MSISFRTGQYVDPSGFPLAVVNVPAINPNDNISLTDNSYTWEENITSSDSSVVGGYVTIAGSSQIINIPAESFLVTNQTATLSTGTSPVPLYYKHICRFYHYTYGNNPISQVEVTDSSGAVISGLAYIVQPTRISKYVYQINVLTNFTNPPGSSYKIKYNRCSSTGTNIYPNWTETLNATPLFSQGYPSSNVNQYTLLGPELNGTYTIVVPVVPTLSALTNTLGVSIVNSPGIVTNIVSDAPIDYYANVVVTYTITATSSTTFTIQRDHNPVNGSPVSNSYLSSATGNTWGTAAQFTTGTTITIPGISICLNTDNILVPNDQAYFEATESYYYTYITAYEAIYLEKPINSTPDNDWYMQVSNGSFRRTMNAFGVEVPLGYGTTFQYSIPEYNNQVFDPIWDAPYVDVINERPAILDSYTISLVNTPLFIDPSSVFNNPINPGFPPSGLIAVTVDKFQIPQTSITDWDVDNGIVTLGQIVNSSNDVSVSYIYEQDNYVYQGFTFNGVYNELNLNPSPGLGWGIYASGVIATIYARPVYNVTASGTINTAALYHNFTGTPSGVFDFNLGSVSVGPNSSISDVSITDTRTRGGGLSSDGIENISQVEVLDPESQFFWDVGYFDGQAVPADGVIVVDLPSSILVENGGAFTKDEVKSKVYKHCALGTYCIIQYQ